MNLTLSRRRVLGALPAVKLHGPGGKMPPGLCGGDVEASYCGRDYEREWRPRMEELNLEARR